MFTIGNDYSYTLIFANYDIISTIGEFYDGIIVGRLPYNDVNMYHTFQRIVTDNKSTTKKIYKLIKKENKYGS
jgi:hypothetical protein